MAGRSSIPQAPLRPANLTPEQNRNGIPKLKRRLAELEVIKPDAIPDFGIEAEKIVNKINATLVDVFGQGTLEYRDYSVSWGSFTITVLGGGVPRPQEVRQFQRGLDSARSALQTALELMSERLEDSSEIGPQRALRAYQGLDLHPEIDRAAGDLYRGGHYANAVEDAVKALNALVRMRSGEELDGASLMDRVFAPKNPILRFNDLRDQSDQDEQKGFMMMFSGAVAGLRNPRAHKLIKDDPERAIEFIAYVSLLAKLLDGAKKGPPASL
jgi:uncharacterized protein (TIGR02391 family)